MKKSFDGRFVALLAGSALLLMSGVAQAAIQNSKHDLSSGSTGGAKFSGTAEICVFCHTPHGADSTASVPLWNKTLPASTAFSTYASLGTSSLVGGTTTVGSVSIACLSCHDGVSTINSVINAPGSGLTNATYTAGAWTATGVSAVGLMTGAATTVGTNLQNDHPVGIQWAGGKNSAYVAGTDVPGGGTDIRNPDFKALKAVTGKALWYVDMNTNSIKEKTDLPLYTRPAGAITTPTGDQPFVECATCHDPHANGGTVVTFLRTSNAASALCLACHDK